MSAPGAVAESHKKFLSAQALLTGACRKITEQESLELAVVLSVEPGGSLHSLASFGQGATALIRHAGTALIQPDTCPILSGCLLGDRVFIPDIQHETGCRPWQRAARKLNFSAMDLLPIMGGSQVIAVLATFAPDLDRYTQPVLDRLANFAESTDAAGLISLILRTKLECRERRQRALADLAQLVAGKPRRHELFPRACRIISSALQSALVALVTLPSNAKSARIVSARFPHSAGVGNTAADHTPDDTALEALAREACQCMAPVLSRGIPDDETDTLPQSWSALAIPLQVGKGGNSALVSIVDRPMWYHEELCRFFEQSAKHLENALTYRETEQEKKRYYTFYSALSEFNDMIVRDAHPAEIYEEMCRQITKLSPDLFAFFISNGGDKNEYMVTSWSGDALEDSQLQKIRETALSARIDQSGGRGIVGQVLRSGKTVVWTPTKKELTSYEIGKVLDKYGVRSLLGVPLFRSHECTRILVVAARDEKTLTPELIALVERMAEYAGYATFNHHQRDLLQYQTLNDALTGLPNRTLCADRLKIEMARANQEGRKIAVLAVDLDKLREINDELGHKAGDKVIIAIAERLRSSMQEADTLVRYSGDEFIALISLEDSALDLGPILDRFMDSIRQPIHLADQAISITASIGIALFPDAASSPEDLLRRAELAMHRRKSAGGDGWNLFETAIEEQVLERLSLKKRFLQAVEDGEIIFHYQPIVDMSEGRIIGAEALARWQHPERGLIPPVHWIPFVEEDPQLISLLGRHALESGIRQLEKWHSSGRKLSLSINLGAKHFLSDGFLDDLKEALAKAPTYIIPFLALEITESAIVTDFSHLSRVLAECRRLGVRISLDDFGTGHGSLVYLQKLPVDNLKIDLEFVLDLPWSIRAFSIVAGTLQISQLSNMIVLAEGVETEEHGIRLLQMGCRYAQGYGISPPLGIEDFDNWSLSWTQPASWEKVVSNPLLSGNMQLLAGLVYHRTRLRLLLPSLEADNQFGDDELRELTLTPCPLESWTASGTPPLLPAQEHIHERMHRLEDHGLNLLMSGEKPGPWLADLMRRRSTVFELAMEQRLNGDSSEPA